MELDHNTEVSLHAQAADIEWTLNRLKNGGWEMTISGMKIKEGKEIGVETEKFQLTDVEASATVALFIGEIESNETLNGALYKIAEKVWENVPQHLRPIP